ncbi:hypothetical protein AK812_SmicGene41785 [Symbiodinium microadriaticum]|uniref:Uncharacterized protein n=1 Tax=Symbiodinium microadriaticum TaxID=2951 RepID=A0A1Q9C575_SYMMI|nr:hypothetical protein AK812_SmicGene41785 [Symbiodinium microadriaticum]
MSSKTWFRPQKSDSTIFVASDLMDKLSDKITKAVQDLARSGLFEMVSHEGMDKHNPKKKMAGPRRGMQHYKLATWEAIQAKQEAKALCDELQLNRVSWSVVRSLTRLGARIWCKILTSESGIFSGVTSGEIAALRRLAELEDGRRRFLIMTTEFINSKKIFDSMRNEEVFKQAPVEGKARPQERSLRGFGFWPTSRSENRREYNRRVTEIVEESWAAADALCDEDAAMAGDAAES